MSSRWIPRWQTIKINVNQREEIACYDQQTRMYACAKCSPECLKGGIPDRGSYFFNEKDLVDHILAHKYALWEKKRPKQMEIEEEEENEDEED
ncbi:hypothetical protein GWK48_06305 [Metallosphaera tengchongensis]|uniref:Uncharacterized protein n=1 Tax=Metallosphaera tengchongensis TaxID=1532350 RepID=A0A6N0NY43_9CREN|nr:hypothetical protein [Metallosphaera tengchongensis]QKR00041.1 hypothetical protein GWK48_06305 [Metallosphaera tengchongensis]